MATFEGELEISFSSGPMSPPTAVAQDGGGRGNASSSSSSPSSFLSNLFDPSIVDPSYTTSTDVPKFAPPSVILIEEIDGDNGTVQIVDENDGGGGADEIDRVRYEHDVYFVLVVVTVSLTVLVMVTFAIYRIVENVMEGGGGRREDRGRRRGGRGGEATSSTPPRATHPSVVGSSPQGHVGRAHSVEFLSGELLMKTPPQVRCIDRTTERKSVHSIDRLPLSSFSPLSLCRFGRCRGFGLEAVPHFVASHEKTQVYSRGSILACCLFVFSLYTLSPLYVRI